MFICMAYYEGENLRDKISQGDLDEGAILNTVIEVARGLVKAHENGIVHRDIKPANIILTAFLGKIRVLVRPYGAIYVDDELKKKDTFTPYTEELQVGQHKIRAVHPTLGTFEKYVDVQAAKQVEIPFDFNQKVTATILSQDETGKAVWAGIYIDNKYSRQVTPKEVQLSPGQYKILVRRQGYSAEGGEKVINVKHGMEPVKFILRRLNN